MLVAHLSDPHLTVGALAAEPAASLHRALGRVLSVEPRPDFVVITGDLVEHGRAEEYDLLRELLDGVPVPVHLAAGNHDDRDALLQAFRGSPHLGGSTDTHYAVEYPQATLAVLDSLVPGRAAGTLGEAQLAWLNGVLARRTHEPAFVAVHHPPIDVGIPFLDSIRLLDGDALAGVVGAHPRVARVLAGHVHRTVSAAFAGTLLSIAPSTYRTSELAMRADRMIGYLNEPTSFLLHQLTGTGCITHTVPVSHAAAPQFALLPT